MKLAATASLLLAALSVAPSAHALCVYHGEDNVKTTIAREFKDSHWVVRAKVVSAKDHFSDEDESWTIYRLEVEHTYKGQPPHQLLFFTFRNSGGFYMDKAWARLPAGHDIGSEYLLFLNPWPARKDLPPLAKDSVFVNYSCGVSGPWPNISPPDRERLSDLEQGR
jgi:hypothetical protein